MAGLDASIILTKPVARIIIEFKDKTSGMTWASVDDVNLSVLPADAVASRAALPLPVPPMAG
jgi:hypothetical protein